MNGLEQLYQQVILDHSKRRIGDGFKTIAETDPHGESHQYNPTCGDEIRVRATVADGRVTGLEWEGQGCSISMASASVLTELAVGEEREEFTQQIEAFRSVMRSRGTETPDEELLGDASAFAGVSKFPARVKCAMLAWVAAEDAVNQASHV